MRRFVLRLLVASILFGVLVSPSHASFHLWFIKEIYSNHDGSVQFIELFTSANGQQFLSGHDITSTSNTFNFTNSPSPTSNHHLLLATAGIDSIPGGAVPDYIIPSNFFDPAGDTISFAGTFDVNTFTNAPVDGVMSLNYTSSASAATVAANTPRNYAGNGGSIDLSVSQSPNGDYNGDGVVSAADYAVWRDTLGTSITLPGDTTPGTVTQVDYNIWRGNFGATAASLTAGDSSAAVPEPATFLLFVAAVLLMIPVRRA